MGNYERFEEVPEVFLGGLPDVEYENVAPEQVMMDPSELFEDEQFMKGLRVAKERLEQSLITGLHPEALEASEEA